MVYEASTWVIPVIIAITLHEAAHGFVALLFGDGTAWRLGRVSFNPLKHIDLFGTILMPCFSCCVRRSFSATPSRFRLITRRCAIRVAIWSG